VLTFSPRLLRRLVAGGSKFEPRSREDTKNDGEVGQEAKVSAGQRLRLLRAGPPMSRRAGRLDNDPADSILDEADVEVDEKT
jgi:hypothetical protein